MLHSVKCMVHNSKSDKNANYWVELPIKGLSELESLAIAMLTFTFSEIKVARVLLALYKCY